MSQLHRSHDALLVLFHQCRYIKSGIASWPWFTARTTFIIMAWLGDSSHTGSVAAASPVSWKAWQRQPPKSIAWRGQLRHGSGIQLLPRKRLNMGESFQIQLSERCRTFSVGNVVI